jgi:hypothetical protein
MISPQMLFKPWGSVLDSRILALFTKDILHPFRV